MHKVEAVPKEEWVRVENTHEPIIDKEIFEKELKSLVYGAVEIRENNSNKYIYVHYREDGVALTKYVGEYSDELYNLVLSNSIKAKELKRQIREITKKLKQLNYAEEELSSKVQESIDFAKRNLVATIYKQAILEGVATTFADTESIIEGGKVRNVPVIIGATKWTPELPIESVIKEELEEIFFKEIEDVDKAIELLLYTMKKQIFIDGNKRTSIIFINHYLILKGKGIIVIPAELIGEFKDLLIPYYEGKDDKEIKKFIKEKCYLAI